ncbi:hypothetical protein [Rhizobium leguminosarum]
MAGSVGLGWLWWRSEPPDVISMPARNFSSTAMVTMLSFLLLILVMILGGIVGHVGPKRYLEPGNLSRQAENAQKTAFQVISKKTARRRALIVWALLIALIADISLLVWLLWETP